MQERKLMLGTATVRRLDPDELRALRVDQIRRLFVQ
jgi:hypothetical protein